MRILLLGDTGQLGWELRRALPPLGEVSSLDFPRLDLSQPESVRAVIREVSPQVIVNATAYTAVDRAESEPAIAMAINGYAPGIMAEEARELEAVLIHYSTDYAFDGRKEGPYVEEDPPNPINMYGESKLAGERAIQATGGSYLILRTSWVYSLRRPSFVTKVLEWAGEQPELRIVDDQVSGPTWARMLAEVTAQLLARESREDFASLRESAGIYHLAGSGHASRYEWAQAIVEYARAKGEIAVKQILPARSEEFPTPAQRPALTMLDCTRFERTFGLRLPGWEEALQLAMDGAC